MALYRYVKAPVVTLEPVSPAREILVKRNNRFFHFFPLLLVFIGLGLLTSVTYPILSYRLVAIKRFQPELLSPVAASNHLDHKKVLSESQDLTLISNWFPEVREPVRSSSKVTHYTLSVPRLKIFDATVTIGGENLKESLIHYGGTSLPGEIGSTVIFGHSVLPQFFNPKNYLTIFSTLPELEKGDEVLISFDGIRYKYQVYTMVEVDPLDVSILEQRYDNSYLTLVTCVPPGTYWRRLAVRARLTKI